MREKPNFGHTVRWIHTTDGGSCPLPVLHTFCTSASDNSWCLIFDNFLYAHGCLTCLSTVSQKCGAVSSVCVGWPQLPLVAEMRPCPHRSTGGSALPAGVHTCMWTQEKHINTEWTMWEYYESRVCLKLFWNAIQVLHITCYTLRVTIYARAIMQSLSLPIKSGNGM